MVFFFLFLFLLFLCSSFSSLSLPGKLEIVNTSNAGTPLTMGDKITPLLTLDVWEHSYYVDHQNRRPVSPPTHPPTHIRHRTTFVFLFLCSFLHFLLFFLRNTSKSGGMLSNGRVSLRDGLRPRRSFLFFSFLSFFLCMCSCSCSSSLLLFPLLSFLTFSSVFCFCRTIEFEKFLFAFYYFLFSFGLDK